MNNKLVIALSLPLLILTGCLGGGSSSSSSPQPGDVEQISSSLNIMTKMLYYESEDGIQLQTNTTAGSLDSTQTGPVTALVYSDASCSTVVQVPGPQAGGEIGLQIRDSLPVTLIPLPVDCSDLDGGKSSCQASWSQIATGTYYVQAHSGSLTSSCSSIITSSLSLDELDAYNTDSKTSMSSDYSVLYDTSRGLISNVQIESKTGLTYEILLSQNAQVNPTVSIASAIGSTATLSQNDDGSLIVLYTVGTLVSKVTDKIALTDANGYTVTTDVNLAQGMTVSTDSDPNNTYHNSGITANILTESSMTVTAGDDGTAPFTYQIVGGSTIGSTFVNGLYTAGFTSGYVSERLQVTDSLGHQATVLAQVYRHTYLINGNERGVIAYGVSSISLTAGIDVSVLPTTIGQWVIGNTQIVDETTVVTVALNSDASKIATVSNCHLVSNALTCDLSATANANSKDLFYIPLQVNSASGTALIQVYMYYHN